MKTITLFVVLICTVLSVYAEEKDGDKKTTVKITPGIISKILGTKTTSFIVGGNAESQKQKPKVHYYPVFLDYAPQYRQYPFPPNPYFPSPNQPQPGYPSQYPSQFQPIPPFIQPQPGYPLPYPQPQPSLPPNQPSINQPFSQYPNFPGFQQQFSGQLPLGSFQGPVFPQFPNQINQGPYPGFPGFPWQYPGSFSEGASELSSSSNPDLSGESIGNPDFPDEDIIRKTEQKQE